MGISGLVAQGVISALDEAQERRLREQIRRQQEQQQAAQLALQQQQQAAIEADRAEQRNQGLKRLDLEALKYRDEQAAAQTDRNIGLDAANVMRMPGMTPQAKADELEQSLFRNPNASVAPALLRRIEGLTRVEKPVQYTYTDPKTGNKTMRFGDPASAGGGFDMGNEPKEPKTPERPNYIQVTGPDGKLQMMTADEIRRMGGVPTMKAGGAESQEKLLTAGEVKEAANTLLTHRGFDGAFGLNNSRFPTLKQDTADAEALRDRVSSLLQLANMGKMKGVLSDNDMKVIKAASTTLSNRLSGKAARAELARVIQIMERIESGMPGMDMATSRDDQPDDVDAEIARIRALRRPGGR